MVRRCPFDLLLSGDRNVEFSFSREEELLNEKAPIFLVKKSYQEPIN